MRIRRVVAAAAFAFSVAALASNTKADGDGFSLSLTPYAWLPGVEGTVTAGGLEADVDASVADIDSVESSVFVGYEAIADDFSAGNFTFDATLHGPVIGWRFTF